MAGSQKKYDRGYIARYYDDYGDREWGRMVANPVSEISLHIHTHYLKKYVPKNARVLEIGAGPGRFTHVLAEIGGNLVVSDVSPTQLELNQENARELGFSSAVEDWALADICDLSQFEDASFDRVVAYGGPFSYVLEQRDAALQECLRVMKPGGKLLLSVMSLWGTLHSALISVVRDISPEVNRRVVASGDLLPETYDNRGHYLHMFRAAELSEWLQRGSAQILALSASNCLSATYAERLAEIRKDPEQWDFLLELELEACAQLGALDMGTHLLAVAEKPA
jgi:SAM-dependent methyltransferase